MKNRITRLLTAVLAFLGICLCMDSCRDSQLIDETEFNLFYPGLTDVGPGMDNVDIPVGSYIGAQPSDFSITGITFNGESFQDNDGIFSIDAATGTVHIGATSSLSIGQYAISISCIAGGKSWNFPDAITINMMKPVPEEIKVEPAEFTIKMSDVIAGYFVPENYTAQIYSDSEAISITGYEVSEVKLDGDILGSTNIFTVSTDGVVSLNIDEDTTPGVYQVSFKLYTALSGDDPEEGLFADALTVTLASAPTEIIYPFLPVKIEQNGIARTSETPTVRGSQIDLAFELAGINPEFGEDYTSADWISIDAATGAIIVKEGHPFTAGEEFTLDITVSNDNGSTTFPGACQLQVVDHVAEVSGFSYEAVEIVRGGEFHADPAFEGDDVTFSFENLPAELSELTINTATGRIAMPRGNALPEGSYKINVIARNYKNSLTAIFDLTIGANPYYFTTVSWGTNLDDAHADDPDYVNQFRYKLGTTDIPEISIKSHDIPDISQARFAIRALTGNDAPKATINETTGAIKFSGTRPLQSPDNNGVMQDNDRRIDIYLITVTNGSGTSGETVVEIPVFLHSSEPLDIRHIQYTPLVCKINPRTGGTTHGIEFIGEFSDEDMSNLLVDYRRGFNFYNLGGPSSHKSGAPSGNDTFLKYLWDFYWQTTVQYTSSNYGAKAPMSYLGNSGTYYEGNGITPKTLAMPLGYVNPDRDYGVTINPRKFTRDNAWADGLFIGQIIWQVMDPVKEDGSNKNERELETEINNVPYGPGRTQPLVIWFDPDYEN